MDLITSIIRHGGVATLRELRHDGIADRSRITALREGRIQRIRNGWFCVPDAPVDLVQAARLGGRLSCASALRHYGLWTMPDSRLHVAVADNASRLRSPADRRAPFATTDPAVVVHWGHHDWAPARSPASDTLVASLAHYIRCAPQAHALVAIDSALNQRKLSAAELRRIASHLPDSYGWIVDRSERRAQSGLETLARHALRGRGIRVRVQVEIAGVGTVDCLIGDRLILELDSRAHHLGRNYETDRTRDLHAIERGYIVLRVSYHRVLHDWPSVERAVLALVRRRDHEWSGMHRRMGLAPALV